MFEEFFHKIKGDKYIWAIVGMLTVFSLLAVYSSTTTLAYRLKGGNTEFYLFKHLILVMLGIGLMYFFHKMDYRYLSKLSVFLLILAALLLPITLFLGTSLNQASRWLTLPVLNISFQTSDFAKLALIMYLARSLSKMQKEPFSFNRFLLEQILPIVLICGLILPADLSTATMLFLISVTMLFVGRVRITYLLRLGAFMVIFLTGAITLITNHENLGLTKVGRISTWDARLESFISLEDNVSSNYQVKQAKIAIATGSVFGNGPGNSGQRDFLPHPYSDFIYAIIIEEYGLVFGAMSILLLYLWFLHRVIKILLATPKAFGGLLAVGLGLSICVQALIHMAVNVSIFPVTGLPLPLVSMGGTSMWFSAISVGIILSVSRYTIENKLDASTN